MPTHLVAMVQTNIISQWKRLALKYACGGKPVFAYGSDDKRQFKQYAGDGATLWILASRHGHPPSLVARLTSLQRIDEEHTLGVPPSFLRDLKHPKRDERYRFRVKGGRGSCFFGHNNASTALKESTILGADGVLKRSGQAWDPSPSKHGNIFLRPKRIEDPEPLATLAGKLKRRTVFMSWKHCDVKGRAHANMAQRRRVLEFARHLNRHDVAVWLDELALPGYEPRTRDDGLLELLLKQGISQSRVVIAVATKHYGCQSEDSETNWTKNEWESKARRNRAVLVMKSSPSTPLRSDQSEPCVELDSRTLQLTGTPAHAAKSLIASL